MSVDPNGVKGARSRWPWALLASGSIGLALWASNLVTDAPEMHARRKPASDRTTAPAHITRGATTTRPIQDVGRMGAGYLF
jgi:hypothetical protein